MLFLADIFEKFRNKFTETYEHDPNHFLSAPDLAGKHVRKRLKQK